MSDMRRVFLATLAGVAIAACGSSEPAPSPESVAPQPEMADNPYLVPEEERIRYVESRHNLDQWPGANPPGIAILEDVEILGRDMMRTYEVSNRACPLQKYSVFELGNNARNRRNSAFFYTSTVKADIEISGAMKVFNPAAMDGSKLAIEPSDQVQFLGVTADNWAQVDINGEEFELQVDEFAEQSNIMDVLAADSSKPELWLKITCENDLTSWFIYDELIAHPDIAPSLNDPMREPADLTDEDIAAIRARDAG